MALLGALIGIPVGLVLYIGSCYMACLTVISEDDVLSVKSAIIVGVIVSTIIGCIIGIRWDNENMAYDEQKEEEKRQQEVENHQKVLNGIFNKWYNQLDSALKKIEVEVDDASNDCPAIPENNMYNKIWAFLDNVNDEQPERYKKAFEKRISIHFVFFSNIIKNAFAKNFGRKHIRRAYNSMVHMYFVQCNYNNVNKFETEAAKSALNDFWQYSMFSYYYLEMKDYGNCILPLNDKEEWAKLSNEKNNIETKLNKQIQAMANMDTSTVASIYSTIAKNVVADCYLEYSQLMWYYALQKPFDANAFERVRTMFNKLTMWDSATDNCLNTVNVESILAGIAAKKNLGGSDAIKQEEEYMFNWLNSRISQNDDRAYINLASGLAWLELFNYEKKVMLRLVEAQVQLPPELQERLEFLNKGISQNVKVYSVNKGNEFMFDSSSVDWNNNDFDVFFRNAEMKKIQLNYSLVISKWTKTLPLASGQKVLQDKIYAEFMTMIDDFDGEVTCRKVNARAVNLENLEYENAIEFHFNSKRNKCISVLFSCEKYGKNLNITIFTMFTPEEKCSNDELKKYALAIKENIYMESFRESILQSVDSVLKEDKKIYDDDDSNAKRDNSESSSSKKVFE